VAISDEMWKTSHVLLTYCTKNFRGSFSRGNAQIDQELRQKSKHTLS